MPVPPVSGISFVIPAYDAADTIIESIASVMAVAVALEGVEVEVVVVDDGSTDATAALVAAEFAAEPRVHLFRHRRNRGGAAARNTAVEHASNAWIFCLDSDNLADPASLRRMVAMAATGNWDVVAPAETRYFQTSVERPTHSWFWDRETVEVADVLRMYETPVASGNYLFTADVWARAGGYPEFAASLDAWGFGVRLLFEGARFGVCPETFYLHRQGHASYYMRDNDDRRAVAAAQVLLPYLGRLSVRDQKRLIGDGELLDFFAEIPTQPITVDNADDPGPARRIVVQRNVPAQSALPQTTNRPGESRVRAAARRAWRDSSPRDSAQRLLRIVRRRRSAPDR
ncbi:MAG TPA: glycosyltransferase [Acidimicrobiia bacterium]|nr:glycosyltransferase [Acidimicrobiia bacterium]